MVTTGVPILVAEGVSKVYLAGPRVEAVRNLSLTIAAGESVAVMGPSGSGKTTLLNLLAGLDVPSQGRIVIAGRELGGLDEEARAHLRRTTIATVFQQSLLLPTLSAAQNVALPLQLRGDRVDDRDPRVTHALDAVGLAERRHHLPDELSGGERQRVAVARALVIEPAVILADEPTGNLDSATGEQVLALFHQVTRGRGAALVLVTHDAHAARGCDRVLRIRDGRLEP